MHEIISSIDKFYRSHDGRALVPGKTLFVASEDTAVGQAVRAARDVRVLSAYIRTTISNCAELVRSSIRARPSTYFHVSVTDMALQERCLVNFKNGTVLVFNEQCVDKFYFKDLEFFQELYRCVAPFAGLEVDRQAECLVVRWRRLSDLTLNVGDAALLVRVQSQLHAFSTALDRCVLRRELFSVATRLDQLYLFYSHGEQASREAYREVALLLEKQAERFQRTPCHGDLWKQNVLQGDGGRVVLIDFDKAIFFVRVYDYVYYYLMTRALPRDKSVDCVLERCESHANGVITFLEKECGGMLGQVRADEVILAIRLFAFLKLVERDLRYRTHGKSLGTLHAELGRQL